MEPDLSVPVSDSPLTGAIPDLLVRPADEFRVIEDQEDNKHYTVLSVLENEDAYMYEWTDEEYITMENNELDEFMNRENVYHHSILSREFIPIDGNTSDTLALYSYAVENPYLDDARGLTFGWGIENQNPIKNMPSLTERIVAPNFEELRNKATNSENENVKELYRKLSGDTKDIIDMFIISAEYNARQIFNMRTEPTYSEEIASRLEDTAISIKEVQELSECVYN